MRRAAIACTLLIVSLLFAKPIPDRPEPPPKIVGSWQGFCGNNLLYNIVVFRDGDTLVAHWTFVESGDLSYIGVWSWDGKLARWTEDYNKRPGGRDCTPWLWRAGDKGALVDVQGSWSIRKP